jgi:hypothetical protein
MLCVKHQSEGYEDEGGTNSHAVKSPMKTAMAHHSAAWLDAGVLATFLRYSYSL